MEKHMFSSCIIWLTSSGTLWSLDFPVLLSASVLMPVLTFFGGSESGQALFYSSIWRKTMFPVMHQSTCLKWAFDFKSWQNGRDLEYDKKNCSCKGKRGISIYLWITDRRTENLHRFICKLQAPNKAFPARSKSTDWEVSLVRGLMELLFSSVVNLLFFYNCKKVPGPEFLTGFPSVQSQMFIDGSHVLGNLYG